MMLSLETLVDEVPVVRVGGRLRGGCAPYLQVMEINAPRQVVYEALTDSDKASAWFGFPIGIEPCVGGRFAMGGLDSGSAARIIDLEPGRTMSVDWGDMGIGTWELADSAGKTRLTFVQSGFKTPRPPYAAWLGTMAGFASLRRYLELENRRPIDMAAA